MSAMLRVEMFLPREGELTYAVKAARDKIVEEVGGLTETEALGYWTNGNGVTYVEGVVTFLFFVEDTEDNRLWVEEVAREFKADAVQECVLYVLNGNDAVFIDD